MSSTSYVHWANRIFLCPRSMPSRINFRVCILPISTFATRFGNSYRFFVTWVSSVFSAAVITGFASASPLPALHGVSSRYHPGVAAGFGPIAGLKIGHASAALGTSAQDPSTALISLCYARRRFCRADARAEAQAISLCYGRVLLALDHGQSLGRLQSSAFTGFHSM